jgi:6-phosphogluconolactonase
VYVESDLISFAGSPAELHDSADDAAASCARLISAAITESLNTSDTCRVAFCGGNAADLVLRHLTAVRSNFDGVEFFLVDERCVGAGQPERNDNLLHRYLSGRAVVRSIPAELGPHEGAAAYVPIIESSAHLDIVFLSIGDDGHVASIFPDHPAATSSDAVVAVLDAPKPPTTRISLSIPTMRRAPHRLVAAFGAEKRAVVDSIYGGWDSPAVQVRPTRWYLDRAAAEDIRG